MNIGALFPIRNFRRVFEWERRWSHYDKQPSPFGADADCAFVSGGPALVLVAGLLAGVLAGCAHQEKLPPGMGRLVVKCCEPPDEIGGAGSGSCQPLRETANIIVDGVALGTCLDWTGSGRNLAVGSHMVQVRVQLEPPIEKGQCCVDWTELVEIHAGEARTVQAPLERIHLPD